MNISAEPAIPPLLRAPPFQGIDEASGLSPPPPMQPVEGKARIALFKLVRTARVGGTFWAEPPETALPSSIIVRPRTDREMENLRGELVGQPTFWIANSKAMPATGNAKFDCGPDIDPWPVLTSADRLIAHGDDEWVALARIAGLPVRILSSGPFGEPDETPEMLDDRAMQALCQPMRDPFTGGWLAPQDTISLLAEWRRVIDANRGGPGEAIVAACGISWWKRSEIRRFLWIPDIRLRILSNARRALAVAESRGGALAIWPSRVSPPLIAEAKKRSVPLVRVEDGFLRSAGLGSNLVPPSSVIVDRQGIHFDPTAPSDLEAILADADFPQDLLDRARRLRETIIETGISKYAKSAKLQTAATQRKAEHTGGRRVVLVPGQVENDMSVLAGGGGMTSNLELLRRTRSLEGDAEIWWRPHPDVDAGHRIGAVQDEAALEYANRIVREESMSELLDIAHSVHVLTSLSGFEALLRGCEVTCHGTPFYAGWGLTRDLAPVPGRRDREISLDELVAGVLLLYPRYLDPVTGLPCPPEVLVRRMVKGEMPNRQSWIQPLRRMQGRIMTRFRSRDTGRVRA